MVPGLLTNGTLLEKLDNRGRASSECSDASTCARPVRPSSRHAGKHAAQAARTGSAGCFCPHSLHEPPHRFLRRRHHHLRLQLVQIYVDYSGPVRGV